MGFDSTELVVRVAIITGARQGMGRACAMRLVAAGACGVVNDLKLMSAQATASGITLIGGKSLAISGDVTRNCDVDHLVNAASDHFGGVHILINNAGVLLPTRVFDLEEAEWDTLLM